MLKRFFFLFALCAFSLADATAALNEVRVYFRGFHGDTIDAYWYAAQEDNAPTVIVLHGCNGLFESRSAGEFSERFQENVERFTAMGYNVLMPDSLTARGLDSICVKRPFSPKQRADDLRAAVSWLRAQPRIDSRHIAVVGFSNGATTLLRALDTTQGTLPIAGAIAFYPGCSGVAKKKDYRIGVPLLLLTGQKDNWTPEVGCKRLFKKLSEAKAPIRWISYPDAWHGFDSSAPLHERRGIVSRTDGTPVKTGGNPQARQESEREVKQFLREIFKERRR